MQEVSENRLQIDGRACTIHKDTQEYENAEEMKVLMPWNGDTTCLIDRFDARANLDFWREPVNSKVKVTDDEREVEEVCLVLELVPFRPHLNRLSGSRAAAVSSALEDAGGAAVKQVSPRRSVPMSLSMLFKCCTICAKPTVLPLSCTPCTVLHTTPAKPLRDSALDTSTSILNQQVCLRTSKTSRESN
jgi:Alternative splicing regulator